MERPTRITRPYMPGYGTLAANDGTGLLHWSWAEERLVASRSYTGSPTKWDFEG